MQILKIKDWIESKPHFIRDSKICIVRIKDFKPFFLMDSVVYDDTEGVIVDFMDDDIRVLVQVGNYNDLLYSNCVPFVEAVDIDCVE